MTSSSLFPLPTEFAGRPPNPLRTPISDGQGGWDPLLQACQQMARARGASQILSLSWPLPGLDPLAVLGSLFGKGSVDFPGYCYLSHKAGDGRVRVLGWGSLRRVCLWGEGRFQAARAFVQELRPHIHEVGILPASWQERPLCFCRFSFSPKKGKGPAAVLALPQWQLWQAQEEGSLTVARLNLEIDGESDLAGLARQAQAFWAHMERLSRAAVPPWQVQAPLRVEMDEAALLARIHQALQAIRVGFLEKVVLAEAVDLRLPSPPPLPSLLAYLEQHHPDCTVFAFAEGPDGQEIAPESPLPWSPNGIPSAPHGPQVFLGASPERLLSVWQGRVQIDALAGSVARGATSHQDQVLAAELLRSPKDRREHQWVVRSVREALGQLGMDPCISPQPQLLRLANIQHLQTVIEAELPAGVHLFDLLARLHPTAAVGGYPQQAALQWIERAEPFDRAGYAAPLGWVDFQGNGEFVVGIRSALVQGDRVRVYAGAGIVADSDPQQELAEIRLKLQALAQALALCPLSSLPPNPGPG